MMKKRILLTKPDGTIETPLEVYARAARHIAFGSDGNSGHFKFSPDQAQQFMDKAVQLMADGKFMPNSPVLSNSGKKDAQLSACFVLPIEDNLSSIYLAHKHQGLIQASGGGTGFNFSNIRSEGIKAD